MQWYIYLLFSIAGFVTVLMIFLIVLKLYMKLTTRKCTSKVKLHGTTAIVTGANTGIGYETALNLAERGAKVILACRDRTRGLDAVGRIIRKSGNTDIHFRQLDLSSFISIRQFSEEINNLEERLNILVNNAGAIALPSQITEDGLLLLMETNYFGPVLLTVLLLDLLKKTPRSRIVNVSSLAASLVKNFDVNDLNQFPETGLRGDINLYSRSKLCNILFTIKLAEQLQGTGVTTYSLHPGTVTTEINRNMGRFAAFLVKYIFPLFLKNALEGAQTTIYCSVEESIEHLSGKHFEDCHEVRTYKTARDPDLPDKLWRITKNFLKLDSFLNV